MRPELRRIDSRALGEFISCGAVLENRTLFEGIHALPPASAWIFRNGSLESKRQLFPSSRMGRSRNTRPGNLLRELREAFTQNLPRYFNGQERIAMSLTGGLDTRMIMAWQKSEPGALPCYTFGSMFRESRGCPVSRQVAKSVQSTLSSDHSRQGIPGAIPVLRRAGCIPHRWMRGSKPFPRLYLNELAREIAAVRMTGNLEARSSDEFERSSPCSRCPGCSNLKFFLRRRGRAERTKAG